MKTVLRQILLAKKNLLPPPVVVMTSNTVPAPFVVSASSQFDVPYASWQAYDGSGVDGGATGLWASASVPASITIDYGAVYAFSKVEITGRSTSGQEPRTFDLQSSNDGVTFATFATYTGLTWANGGEMKTFNFTAITARHLRIDISLAGSVASIVLINWK